MRKFFQSYGPVSLRPSQRLSRSFPWNFQNWTDLFQLDPEFLDIQPSSEDSLNGLQTLLPLDNVIHEAACQTVAMHSLKRHLVGFQFTKYRVSHSKEHYLSSVLRILYQTDLKCFEIKDKICFSNITVFQKMISWTFWVNHLDLGKL